MSHRILLIEDTLHLGEILIDILSMEGFEATWATDPLTGLQRFNEILPHLVITDLVMKEMDGYEVIRTIRSRDTDASLLPIIVLSAKASPEDEARTYEMGANLHLKKPCDSKVLIDSINKLLKNGN